MLLKVYKKWKFNFSSQRWGIHRPEQGKLILQNLNSNANRLTWKLLEFPNMLCHLKDTKFGQLKTFEPESENVALFLLFLLFSSDLFYAVKNHIFESAKLCLKFFKSFLLFRWYDTFKHSSCWQSST